MTSYRRWIRPPDPLDDYRMKTADPLAVYRMELPKTGISTDTHSTLCVGDWLIEDRTTQWWALQGDKVVYGFDREEVEADLAGNPIPESATYSEGPVWVVRRSPTGLVWISSDGYGIDVFHADYELPGNQ